MSKLTFGVIGTSKKEDEQRVPIHPDHLLRIPEEYRRQLIFEEGYGAPFDVSDSDLVFQTGGIASRRELLAELGNVGIASTGHSVLTERSVIPGTGHSGMAPWNRTI